MPMGDVTTVWVTRYAIALGGGIRQCPLLQIVEDGSAWVEWGGEYGPERIRVLPDEWHRSIEAAQASAKVRAKDWLDRHEEARARMSRIAIGGAPMWEEKR